MRRRRFLQTVVAALAAASRPGRALAAVHPEVFSPNWDSLNTYRAPEWFRDAKLGLWGQWSPQSVPEQGDWYARNLYLQGSPQYRYHLAHYGHPSRVGYKDICRIWRAERWDPDRLIELYRRAGAGYFVALGNHHDGFDCWNSSYQRWNSANIGPRRDILGSWAAAVRRQGMRFGVSLFSAQNWDWMAPSRGADGYGPLRGVPYDGNLTAEQGEGTWWQGYDPRALYGEPHPAGSPPTAQYIRNFFARAREVARKYEPDLIFFSSDGLPFGDAGLAFAADFYNASVRRTGRAEVVVNTKHPRPGLEGALVWDRLPPEMELPCPWQMDICIGDWHYRRDIVYRGAQDVVPYLVEVVSKNGNLLVNVPIRPDGTLDEGELRFVDELGDWMRINGEAIVGTRPWRRFGEGPTRLPAVDFPFVHARYGPEDFRFTTKGGLLYAIALAWPAAGKLLVRSLRTNSADWPGRIGRVELLGVPGALDWRRTAEGLAVWLPDRPPCAHAFALKISPAGGASAG